MRYSIVSTILFAFVFIINCQSEPAVLEPAVTTPKLYQENQVFFVETNGTAPGYVKLLHLFELQKLSPQGIIHANDPLSLILQGVRIPNVPNEKYRKNRDIAVVITIELVGHGKVEMVAFYQRDVPPGQMLNFNGLLVYSVPEWNGQPPYLRVKVMDVTVERNARTGEMLGEVGGVANSFSNIVPHPIIPVVSKAIQVAGAILGNEKNSVLLDFQLQFFSSTDADRSGGSLGSLREGQWCIVGRPIEESSEFWKQELYIDRATNVLNSKIDESKMRDALVPYVSLVFLPSDLTVSTTVLNNSEAFIRLLASGTADSQSVYVATRNMRDSIELFQVERHLKQVQSFQALEQLLDALSKQQDKESPDVQRLIRLIERISGKPFSNYQELVSWWASEGRGGKIVPDNVNKIGFKWIK